MGAIDKKRIYLDYASSTPVRAAVMEAMDPYWQSNFANPQAVHQEGSEAHQAVEGSRQRIADTLKVQSSEIVFTSGATESNSLALIGAAYGYADAHDITPTVLVGSIAHSSIRNIVTSSHPHIDTAEIPVSPVGRIQLGDLESLITESTAVISVSHANSEIGTVQPIAQISKMVRQYRKENNTSYPLLHVDVSQSALYTSVIPESFGVDMLTINSQKIHGPKGVGVLWIRSGTPMTSLFINDTDRQVGDYQQLRPGTQPVPLIVGMAEAVCWAQENFQKHQGQVSDLQDYFITALQNAFSSVHINGSLEYRSPHNVSITLPDIDHDYFAARLDTAGVAVSTTSACQARYSDATSVVKKISEDEQAIRFSLGIETTKEELDQVINIMQQLM